MTSGNCNLGTWYATLRLCIKKHFLQYLILIKHEICSSRVEWYPRLQISEMHNLRPWKIPFVHKKDLSDVWHVYPPAISIRNQYVPSLLYKIQNGEIFAFDATHLSNISFMNFNIYNFCNLTKECWLWFTQNFLFCLWTFIVICLECMLKV